MIDRLTKLLTLHQADPTDAFCTYALAMETAKLGRTDQALGWLDKTIALDANQAYAYYHKAKLLAEQDRRAEALKTLDEGLAAARRSGDDKAMGELNDLLGLLEG
ncbi:MAG: hypothetical protein ACYC26_09015 [Phycisphaerales bacterium]